jgi:serine/threonine-protein kinase
MSPCPSTTVLGQLLADGLPALGNGPLVEHVGACPRCQADLERLSEDTELRQWRAGPAAETPPLGPEPALAALLDRARDATVLLSAPDGSLPFLGPPVRPGDLGTLGPYAVEAELGRGGMGIVLRAYDEGLQRVVALKVLRPEVADAEARARFVREAQATARLQSDHVVQVHAVVTAADAPPFLVMEFLAGPTLAGLVRERRNLPPRQAAALAAEVAEGVAAAHAAGLIHRDVKPCNILLDPATGRAKMTDFGLVLRLEDVRQTQTGALLGTPCYMAPEQARGETKRIGAAVDVYGVGAVLYELLTGRPPFLGADTLWQVRNEEPLPPRRLQPAVPRDLETVCLKALAKEPGRRYATVRDVADELHRYLRGEPIVTRPVGRFERTWRWCRRNPGLAGLTAALLLVFATGFTLVLWQWRLATANAADALARKNEADLQKAAAVANARRAEDHLREALNAVAVFGTQAIRESDLGKGAEARRWALEARAILERLLKADPDNFALQRIRALNENNLGFWVADPQEALRHYQKALALREQLWQRQPGSAEALHDLARSYQNVGLAQGGLGQPGAARRSLQTACKHLDEVVRANPTVASWQADRAEAYINLGKEQGRSGDRAAALHSTGQARAILTRLIKAHPAEVRFQTLQVLAHVNTGVLHRQLGQPAEALRAYQQVPSLLEKLIRDHPTEERYVRDLALNQENTANVQSELGQAGAALGTLERLCTLREALARRAPNDAARQAALGTALSWRGQMLRHLDRRSEAAAVLRQAVEAGRTSCLHGPQDAQLRRSLSEHYGHLVLVLRELDRPHEAAAAALERQKLWPDNPAELFQAACELAACAAPDGREGKDAAGEAQAARQRFTEQALHLLRQAIQRGFQDAERLRNDPALAVLRQHPEFQQLLAASVKTDSPPGR